MMIRSPVALALLVAATLSPLGCGTPDPTSGSGAGATTGGAGGGGGASATGPLFYEDVSPLLMKHCVTCHVKGGIAPFPLITYEDAKPYAGMMKSDTAGRIMPPYPADDSGACHTFKDARWLEDAEIATIGAWADANAPEGDPAHALPTPGPPKGLEDPTVVLDAGAEYTPDASLLDDYRCFVVDPKIDTTQYIVSYELVPDQVPEVHHSILFALESDADVAAVEKLDQDDAGLGYSCFGGPGANAHPVALWAPGGGVISYPTNSGLELTAGRKLVLQIHYNLANGATPDRSQLKLLLKPSVAKPAKLVAVDDPKALVLPPRELDATASATWTVPPSSYAKGLDLWGVLPHMHTRGTKLEESTDKSACIIDVPRWNFHWQTFYQYDTGAIHLDPGAELKVTCHYNTMMDDAPVKWGEGTSDEMCISYAYVTVPE
jgi:Copper type II ascorbate-dependent monooxygenase, C-terminal domain